jgi:uncharacterized protein involved in exopolysaccharide biosynthesis
MDKKNSINIKNIMGLIRINFKFILSIMTVLSLLSVIYSFVNEQYYESYISIYKTNDSSSKLDNIQGFNSIAQTLGFDLNNSDNFDYYIPDLVNSRTLYEALIYNDWETESFPSNVNLIRFWEIEANNGFLSTIFNYFDTKYKAINEETKKVDKAINILSKRIRIDERETGLYLIKVTMKEPRLAKDIANYIALYIKEYISDKMKDISSQNLIFISDRVIEANQLLTEAEDILIDFQKKNYLEIETDPVKQLEMARFMRKVEGNQQIYITLKQQLELIKLDHLKEKSIVNILDMAKIQPDPIKPKKLLILALTIISSFFLAIYLVILKEKIL